jgi:hypothetical protein
LLHDVEGEHLCRVYGFDLELDHVGLFDEDRTPVPNRAPYTPAPYQPRS